MKNIDSFAHVRGESLYLDDLPLLHGTLFARVFDSPVAHGTITALHLADAAAVPGVVRIVTARDLPGENQIGGIVPDEPLLADGHVHFQGMPVALVLADSDEAALQAVRRIRCNIAPLEAITDPRKAQARGELIIPPKQFVLGDTAAAFSACAHVFEGRADVNGQEHLYIETQGAYAVPTEGGGLRVYSSTQGPTAVQRAVARTTGLPMHRVEVEVGRLGGGFGGKEDQANTWAALCAVGALLSRRPVKLSLHRLDDMRMTGKRHPYSADYKIGFDAAGKIQAYEVVFYQNAGAAADLSPAVLERTLFHCTNAYYVPNVTATAYSCRTHLPPNTAFRGFGGPQGMFVIEAALAHAADALGLDRAELQRRNLLEPGDEFPYGQRAESDAGPTWHQADQHFDFAALRREADAFNAKNALMKRGLALMPICFGISFTKTMMNQARALVHVYTDGSVAISTGAVEMGQGVNTKMLQVAAQIFDLPADRIKVHSTNTLRIANTSPSAASATADLNGKAVQMACEAILERLKGVALEEFGHVGPLPGPPPKGEGDVMSSRHSEHGGNEGHENTNKAGLHPGSSAKGDNKPIVGNPKAPNLHGGHHVSLPLGEGRGGAVSLPLGGRAGEGANIHIKDGFVWMGDVKTHLDWKTLVFAAYARRVSLSEHAHYATPDVHFDWATGKGHPFAYHVYGTAAVGVTVDCLRGTYEVDYVKAAHDYGKSMNTAIDLGQIEGGVVQGIGWMTMEEVVYDDAGRLRSNALSTYKVPDIYSVPKTIDVVPLATDRENLAILQSKAVGEPPLMYGIGAYFAIRDAVRAFDPAATPAFDAPFTPEKVLLALAPAWEKATGVVL